MQNLVESVRSGVTAAQAQYLVEESPDMQVGAGCYVTDLQQDELTDITGEFLGGVVERQSFATLHGTCQVAMTTPLEWGWAVIKPYMTLSDGSIEARFDLGAYFTNTPRRSTKEQLATWPVIGYDLLYALDTVVGDAYSVAKGTPILQRVEEILIGRGYTKYLIDQSRAADVTPDAHTWALDRTVHWLTVVNDLLGMVGYQGVWADWNGYLRCQPYERPVDRAAEWYLPADRYTSILSPEAEIEFDYHSAPNRWLGVRANNIDGPPPVEGDGLYTFVNDSVGPTSVDARNGLVITRREDFEVVSQADLISRVHAMADQDMSIPTRIFGSTGPLPLAWHMDRLLLDNADIGEPTEVLGPTWSLPLNGEDMAWEWTVLAGVRE